MQEDIQKNFILLSKVAKEKKYAQEYLGLLARRGDIGSIRIGKRWYTTWTWFGEFLENGLKKKTESAPEVQEVKFEKDEQEVVSEKVAESEIKINFLPAMSVKEEAVSPAIEREEVQKNIPVEKRYTDIPVPLFHPAKAQTGQIRVKRAQPILRDEPRSREVSIEERNRYAVPYKEIKLKKKEDVFSPNLVGGEKIAAFTFSRFAFAMSFVAILFFVAVSGYFVWSGTLLERGRVAGASDERTAGFSGITSGGAYVLTSAGDKMRESLSLSRVIVQAVKEKSMNEVSAQPESGSNAVLVGN
jgi:hypothetical protein